MFSLSRDRSLHVWPLSEHLQQALNFDSLPTEEEPSVHVAQKKPPSLVGVEAETSFSIGPSVGEGSDVIDGPGAVPGTPMGNKSFSSIGSATPGTCRLAYNSLLLSLSLSLQIPPYLVVRL